MKILIFVFILTSSDVWAATTTWLNKPHGTETLPNGRELSVKLSRNGRYIAFLSTSANLVENDYNIDYDIFIKDTQTGEIKIVSQAQNGSQFLNSSAYYFSRPTSDGNYILFVSKESSLPMANGSYILYLKNLQTGEILAETYNGSQDPIVVSNSNPFMSDDARYIYFSTYLGIDNIDTNGQIDIYRKDRLNNTFKLITISTITGLGTTDNSNKILTDVSENGDFVTFMSNSNEIHIDASAANSSSYVGYVRDMQFNTTNIFTKDQSSQTVYVTYYNTASIVSNTGTVYFCSDEEFSISDTNNNADNYKFDTGVVSRLQFAGINQVTDADCYDSASSPSMAIDNNENNLLFIHRSNQLVPGTTTSNPKLFNLDLTTMQVNLLVEDTIYSLSSNSILNKIVFIVSGNSELLETTGTTNQQAFEMNLDTNIFSHVAIPRNLSPVQNNSISWASMSIDQTQLVYHSSANNILENEDYDFIRDLYYFDKTLNTTDKIGINIDFGSGVISPNGQYVVFVSDVFHPITTIELDDDYVFLLDLQTLQYSQIAKGDYPSVSDQGDIVFSSNDSNLVVNDNNFREDIFYFNNTNQTIERINVDANGVEANRNSSYPKIAGEGISTWIVFISDATNLIANDVNGKTDIFMRNYPNGDVFRVSEVNGVGTTEHIYNATISQDTTKVIFHSKSSILVGSSTNDRQLLMYDRVTSNISLISKRENGIPSFKSTSDYAISNNSNFIAFTNSDELINTDINDIEDIYLYNTLTDEMRIVPRHSDYFYAKIFVMSVDNNFMTPKLGILYEDTNDSVLNLHGFDNISNNNSLFLYQEGGDGEILTINLTGDGFVIGSLGLSCPGVCTHTYPLGYEMTLTASANPNNAFSGWQGDCLYQTSNLDTTCDVRMDQYKTIAALFLGVDDRIFVNSFE